MSMVQLPVGSTLEQTQVVMEEVEHHFLVDQKDAVKSCGAISGLGFGGRGQNMGMVFVQLKDWKLRDRPGLRAKDVAGKAMRALSSERGAVIFAFPPPPVVELGTATGFDLMVQDRGALGHEGLSKAIDQLLGLAAKDPRLARVRLNGMTDVPQYHVDIDWEKAGTLGVPVSSVQNYVSTAFGSAYVGNFVHGGRVKRVYAQADAPFRMLPEDLHRLQIRNRLGGLVPLSAVASGRWDYGSPRLERFNAFPAMNIQGEPAPGRSSGEAMNAMEELIRKLPADVGFEWTGLSYQQRMSESQAGLLYAFSVLVIFLVLAALYESWTVPIAIVLALPLGVHRRCHRDLVAGDVQRRLLPDRAPHRSRPYDEERDPDRPVRDGEPREGDGSRRGDARGREDEAPSDRHDVDGVRVRRSPARARFGRRRRGAEGDRHERPRRHAERHVSRRPPDPAPVRPRRPALRKKEGRPGGG